MTNGLIEKAFSDNDFAIIKLATPVTFSDRVKPICLPSLLTDYDNKVATVSGWGRTIGGGPVSDILQKVNYVCLPKHPFPSKEFVSIFQIDLNTMTNAQCSSPPNLWEPNLISNNMICTYDSGKSVCNGDSGGPLVTNEGKYYSVIGKNIVYEFNFTCRCFVGVVSWGRSGCPVGTNYPNVYARVTSQLLWIKKYISGTTCPKPIL